MPSSERSMTPVILSAYTLVTANGRGVGAVSEALRERRSGLKPCNFDDALLKTYIGRVEGLEDFSLENGLERFDCRNNRLAWLGLQQDGFMVAVAEAKQRYGADRIAVVMGTSTSGILETELAYRNRDPNRCASALVYVAISLHAQHVLIGAFRAELLGIARTGPGHFHGLFIQR